ncbi:hypothetical protein [Cohnella sp. AR92]|uniref:hypothetical protein n=1 Tax=Cohnella sp. AR92 TaxID=648716 RepID=UPI000F8D988B|nr:hypothetical protein [Cohnella sp. AR92]RUS48604.1 hypothetical protein ELR57_04110 [Cohnella sp. AR92]
MSNTKLTTAILLSLLILSGCQSNTQASNASPAAATPATETPAATPSPAPSEEALPSDSNSSSDAYMGIKRADVHRADGFTELFEIEDTSSSSFEPLLKTIGSVYFVAQRGGAGINESGEDRHIVKASELPILSTSKEAQSDLKSAYIRLECAPSIPEAGTNDMGHRDILLYQDPDRLDNAYLAVQNPENADVWTQFDMPGYGTWLSKELDLVLRAGFGF